MLMMEVSVSLGQGAKLIWRKAALLVDLFAKRLLARQSSCCFGPG
jgi:hypothetical protein